MKLVVWKVVYGFVNVQHVGFQGYSNNKLKT